MNGAAAHGGPAAVIESVLREQQLTYECYDVNDTPSFVVALPGERRLTTACWLTVGAHSVAVEAFVMRAPEENHQRLYAFLLGRNTRMYAVAWSIDAAGDVYLTGRLPHAAITADEVDRVLGAVLEYADGAFNHLLELGFGSSIRREWAWRVSRGESLANPATFADFAQRSP